MSRILVKMMASGDPAVKAWAHELVEAARKRGLLLDPITAETLHQAIETPSLFEEPQDGPLLKKLLGRSYGGVVDDRSSARRFQLTSQPQLQGLFSRVLKECAASGEAPAAEEPPSYHALPDREAVVRAAIDLMARAGAVRQMVRDPWLREQALALFNAADEVVRSRREPHDPIRERGELKRVAEYVEIAEKMIRGSRFTLAHEAGLTIRDIERLQEVIPSDERKRLVAAAERLQAMLHAREVTAEFLELALTARWRMMGIHAPFARFALEGDETPSDAAQRIARRLHQSGRSPDVEELALIAGLLVMAERPRMAVHALNECRVHPLMRGSALLLAAWRDRLGRENPLYLDAIEPVILLGAVGIWREPRAERFMLNPDGISKPMEDAFEPLLRQALDEGRPLHLEFGGGSLPLGLKIARDHPSATVLSIEGEIKPIDWELLEVAKVPPNFHLLEGRSEWLAPYATTPFAESATMVAPSPLSLRPMLLSALLAVKPGGRIDFYQPVHEEAPLQLLYDAQIGFEQTLLDPRGAFIPQSGYLRNYQVRLTRVVVPRFEGRARVAGFASEGPSERPLQLAVSAGARDANRLSTRKVGDQTILVVGAASSTASALKR